MTRSAALEFSFFLSIPTMLAATFYKLVDSLYLEEAVDPVVMSANRWTVLAVGFAVSFFVAWAVVAWFRRWVRRRGFVPFSVYRMALGLWVLAALRS